MINRTIIILISILLLSCSDKNQSPSDSNVRTVNVSLTASNPSSTGESGVTGADIKWAENDILYVATETKFKKKNFSALKLVSGAGTSSAVFSGTLISNTGSDTEPLYAFYGDKEKITEHDSGVQVDMSTIPADDDVTRLLASSFLFGKLESKGDDNYSVSVTNAGSVLRLLLTGLPEGKEISGMSMENDEMPVSAIYCIGVGKDNTIIGGDKGIMNWQISEELTVTAGETECYVMMPPCAAIGSEVKVSIKMNDGTVYTGTLDGLPETVAGGVQTLGVALAHDEEASSGSEVKSVSMIGKYHVGDALMFYGNQVEYGSTISPNGDCIKAYGDYVYVGWWKGGLKNRNLMLSRFNIKTKKVVTIEFPEKHVGFQGQYYLAEKKNPDADLSGLKGDSHNSVAIGICAKDGTIHLVYDLHAYAKSLLPDRYFNYRCSKKNMLDVPDEEFVLENFNDHQLTMNSQIAANKFEKQTYPLLLETDDGKLVYVYREGSSGQGNDNMLQYDGTKWSNSFLMFNKGKQTAEADRYSIYGTMRYMEGQFCYGFHVRFLRRDKQHAYYNEGMHYVESVNPFTTGNRWTDAFGKEHQFPLQMPDAVEFGPEPVEYYGSYISGSPFYAKTNSGAMHLITQVQKSNTDRTKTTLHYYKAKGDKEFSIAQTEGVGEMFSFGSSVVMVGLNGGYPYVASCKENTNEWKELMKDAAAGSFSKFAVIKHENRVYIFCINANAVNSQPIYLLEYELGF